MRRRRSRAARAAFLSSLARRTASAAFLEVYADLRREMVDEILPGYGLPAEVSAYQAEVMDYNVPGGKLNRGLSVVHA